MTLVALNTVQYKNQMAAHLGYLLHVTLGVFQWHFFKSAVMETVSRQRQLKHSYNSPPQQQGHLNLDSPLWIVNIEDTVSS